MNPKLQWLRNTMSSLDLQGLIISNPINIKYLTNIEAEGILLLTRKDNIYITDGRYIEQVHSTLTLYDEIIVYNVNDVSKDDYENFFMFCENVGFEENYVTYAKYKELIRKYKINNLVETEHIIEKQRMIKDDEEISNLIKACEITDNCFSYILTYIKPGMTEKQIADEIEEYYKSRTDGLSFETIVASGENTSKPHAVPTDRKIQEQDIITIDMGCKVNGYCSDMTRTFFVGSVPEYVKPVYDLVLKNQEQTIDDMKDGASTRLLTKMVDNDFRLNGYDLIHALGHGVGMEIHEAPYINFRSDVPLKENMVVTDEALNKEKEELRVFEHESKKTKKPEVNEMWNQAFASVLKNVPIYDESLKKTIGTKPLAVHDNKIEGISQDKVFYMSVESDEMASFRIQKNDLLLCGSVKEFSVNGIYVLKADDKVVVRQVKRLDSTKVLLLSNKGAVRTETANVKEIQFLAKAIKVEFNL